MVGIRCFKLESYTQQAAHLSGRRDAGLWTAWGAPSTTLYELQDAPAIDCMLWLLQEHARASASSSVTQLACERNSYACMRITTIGSPEHIIFSIANMACSMRAVHEADRCVRNPCTKCHNCIARAIQPTQHI
jgi:hypothetical protein